MPTDFLAAIREATRLTRAGQLGDATRLIQETLARSTTDDRAAGVPASDLQTPAAEPVNLAAEAAGLANRLSNVFRRTHLGKTVEARLRRPLGETIELLQKGAFATFDSVDLHRPKRHAPVPEGAQFLSRNFSADVGSRSYNLFIPSHYSSGPALIIMLHGCTQDGDDFAAGTRMNDIAEEFGLIVAYPLQSQAANKLVCWNWFKREDQTRGRGEPAIIAGLTEALIAEFSVDRRRVFVAGLSAGGAMAAILGTVYADLYAAVAIHSGLNCGAASDMLSAVAAMRGQIRQPVDRSGRVSGPLSRTIVFHGDADQTVQPVNGDAIVTAAKAQLDDWREETARSRTRSGVDFTRTIVRNMRGLAVIEYWLLHGMGHAWSGGSPAGSYTDGRGPNASREMIRFFLEPAT